MRWRRRTEIFSPCQREEGLSLFVTHAPHWLLSTYYSHPSHPLAPEVYQLPIGRGRSYVGIESLCPYYCVLVILHHSLCTYIVSLTLFFLIYFLSYRVSSVSSSFSSLSCPLSLRRIHLHFMRIYCTDEWLRDLFRSDLLEPCVGNTTEQ
jgi:hypothetical protein